METLIEAINTTPIIDQHAHNLLVPTEIGAHEFMTITTEASGPALKHTPSTLAHLRAVKQLADILDCEPSWEKVKRAIELKRKEPGDIWARRCFSGIETVLIDDGLDPSNVHPFEWHDRLTRSRCKRIVRIERVAENIMLDQFKQSRELPANPSIAFHDSIIDRFTSAIEQAISEPEVAGFKSVICYRVGLAIPEFDPEAGHILVSMAEDGNVENFSRLEDLRLSPYFVHLTARLIERSGSKKPFQFHTGLGDNDIDLGLSNPSHLQTFIETYPKVPVVLLHASYPFSTQAGYLASVYKNCFMDIGEVFPMVSQDGQERIIREALELCPSEKLMWSTDGHWFPETYLLAVVQVREGMRQVLCDYVDRGSLSATEAIKITHDIFFNTSNELYKLGLTPQETTSSLESSTGESSMASWTGNFAQLMRFLAQEPSIQFLRLQWMDYTSILRLRILPIEQALRMFREGRFIGITKAVFGLLQQDAICPGFSATGEYNLYPQFEGVRLGSRTGHATVQCEFQERTGEDVFTCPRTLLRKQVEKAKANGLQFLVGFEVEIVFMSREVVDGEYRYGENPTSEGHAWSTARALHNDNLMDLLELIFRNLERAGIEIQQFHPESSPGQYEFILGPLAPPQAVDTLLAAREIISSAAANAHMRATFFPKPSLESPGTGAHVHISVTPKDHWKMFYAGVLKHMKAIAAFTYSNDASYDRVADGVWSGSTWIAWGTQNRETPLRRIEESHFEIKCVDGLANPYFVLAAIIGAGLQGILDEQPLSMKDCLGDPSIISAKERKDLGIKEQFPKSIREALINLEQDKALQQILGRAFVDTYLTVKRTESKMLEKMDPDKRRNWLIERY